MKRGLILAFALGWTFGAAQWHPFHHHRLRRIQIVRTLPYDWQWTGHRQRIIYLGGDYSPRRDAYVPFAYGSFFYGQSLSEWMRARQRGFRH